MLCKGTSFPGLEQIVFSPAIKHSPQQDHLTREHLLSGPKTVDIGAGARGIAVLVEATPIRCVSPAIALHHGKSFLKDMKAFVRI